jgi:hypothetical protein
MNSKKASSIFFETIIYYHEFDDINHVFKNPYKPGTINYILSKKCWIDNVQWHFEDLIRDPKINKVEALNLKRKIDNSNQNRTDTVEAIDEYFLNYYKNVSVKDNAKLNTESPAWAIDRLSILELKIYHMKEETLRENSSSIHKYQCGVKLKVLLEQKKDLCVAIDQLLEDISSGDKYMKVYKQMKMYNDEELNPILYKAKRK